MTPPLPARELRLPFDDGFARGLLICFRRASWYAIVVAANILVFGIFVLAVRGLKIPRSGFQYVDVFSVAFSVIVAAGSLVLVWCQGVRLERKLSTALKPSSTGVKPSPLAYLDYAAAENLLRLPNQTPVYRLRHSAASETVFRAPRFSASSDAVEMVVDIYERDVKVFEGETPAVTIDLTTGAVHIVEGVQSGSLGFTGEALTNRVHELLGKLPEALTKLPELIMGGLIPLAHYLSGLETSRRLREANKKLDMLLVGRRVDQQALLERIWWRAGEIARSPNDPDARPMLLKYRDELLQLRLTWENEIRSLLQSVPDVEAAWRKNGKAWQLVEHVLPCVEKARFLQLALFADYCTATASGTTETFLSCIIPSEMQKVEEITSAFDTQRSTLRNLDAYAEIAQIADTVNAYYDFLQQLTELPKKNVSGREDASLHR
jgi:hypothetical protein